MTLFTASKAKLLAINNKHLKDEKLEKFLIEILESIKNEAKNGKTNSTLQLFEHSSYITEELQKLGYTVRHFLHDEYTISW